MRFINSCDQLEFDQVESHAFTVDKTGLVKIARQVSFSADDTLVDPDEDDEEQQESEDEEGPIELDEPQQVRAIQILR